MKKFIAYLAALTLVLMVYSCGSGGGAPHLGGGSSVSKQDVTYNIDTSAPGKSVIPFPNDLALGNETVKEGNVGYSLLNGITSLASELRRDRAASICLDNETIASNLAFYTAITSLYLKGFSPNTPIIIPVPKGTQLNESELQEGIEAIDLTKLMNQILNFFKPSPTTDPYGYCALYEDNKDNTTLFTKCASTIDAVLGKVDNQTLAAFKQFIKQNESQFYTPLVIKLITTKKNASSNVAYGYPVVPFNPGDFYTFVVKKNVNIPAPFIAQMLLGNKPLSGTFKPFEKLRELYVYGVVPLLKTLPTPIQESDIKELSTFTVADKTLSLYDYGAIDELAKMMMNNNGTCVIDSGLEYVRTDGIGKICDDAPNSLICSLVEFVKTGNLDNITNSTIKGIMDNISKYAYKYSALDNMTYAGPYSKNEYLQIDSLSDLPLICQSLYQKSASKVKITNIPDNLATLIGSLSTSAPLDNVTPYMLTPNVYALKYIQPIATDLATQMAIYKDNGSTAALLNAANDCKLIFDNATLYDNVTTVIYPPKTQLANLKGFLIFQHGLGRDKSDAGVLANDVQDFGKYIIFAMDLPWHGDRIPPYYVDNQTEKEKLIQECPKGKCYLTANPINDVMNLYQSLLDMHTFTKFVYASDVETMAKVGTTLTGNPLPPLPVYFAGQSMGSITGSMLLNIDNITQSKALQIAGLPANNYISKAVLNVGGANYSAIINGATNPEIAALGEAATGGKYSKNQVGYNLAIALFQLVLDPVDPSFMARNPSIKSKIIMQNVEGDTLVPNTSNELLYYAYNYNYNKLPSYPFTRVKPNYISYDNDTISATAGKWYMFEGDAQYPWINHGFIIHTADTQDALDTMYPSTVVNGKPMINLYYANKAEALARQQMCTFLSPVPIP